MYMSNDYALILLTLKYTTDRHGIIFSRIY